MSGNTILAGGVSGGVFRTEDGGATWTKVSPNQEVYSVTTIVQDPRSGHELTWYYGTGEGIGNSASLPGTLYAGQGIWQSDDGGLNWTQMTGTSSTEPLNNRFDLVFDLAVHPLTGDLYAAILGQIIRFNGSTWIPEKTDSGPAFSNRATDIEIATDGRVYAAFSGKCDASVEGVHTRDPGTGIWSKITSAGSNPDFTPENDLNDDDVNGIGRIVLALAPNNQDKLYILFDNGLISHCAAPLIEAEFWMWNQSNSTFTNYSSKLPDETGCSDGNDPFAVQGGYDLVVKVKPDSDNFVVIGGTNVYKIADITTDPTFLRIGGYASASGPAKYPNHHPDIHALVFDPIDSKILFTGTDGGVHKTTDVTVDVTITPVSWTDLNNNYQTLQYYFVAIDPLAGEDRFIGGTQDNGTTAGGTSYGMPDAVTQVIIKTGDGFSVGISRDNNCVPLFYSLYDGRIFRNCPNGGEITPNGTTSEFVTLFHLDPASNNAIYYASQGTLLRTTNSSGVTSNTWEGLGDTSLLGDNDYFQAFSTSWGTYDDLNSYLLMGGDEGHIYRLDDPQNAVRDLSDAIDITPAEATIAGYPNFSVVTGLAVHPTNNNIILATYANYGTKSIFLTTDKGASWTLVERNLSAHSIRSAAIVEDNGETRYFVGTARGLYSSPDPTPSGSDWELESPNDIGFALVSDLKYRPSDHKLLIGTHGNGIYEATIGSTLGLEEFKNISDAMRLYPNPTQDYLNISLPRTDGVRLSYSVTNLSGQTIFKGILDKETIYVSQLANGMYFLQVTTSDGRKGAKSFIKK